MADSTWQELADQIDTGTVTASVPAGLYQVVVDGVRALPTSRLLFLDLKIETGPEAGKAAQVNLYVPGKEGESPGARVFFLRRMAGFPGISNVIRALPTDIEAALNALADALLGQRCVAAIAVRQDGDYAGTNELTSTKPLEGTAPAAPAAAPAAQPAAPAPQPAAPAAPQPAPAQTDSAPPAQPAEVPF